VSCVKRARARPSSWHWDLKAHTAHDRRQHSWRSEQARRPGWRTGFARFCEALWRCRAPSGRSLSWGATMEKLRQTAGSGGLQLARMSRSLNFKPVPVLKHFSLYTLLFLLLYFSNPIRHNPAPLTLFTLFIF